ncbi:hypothetical protein PMAYCL1PPCAC_28127, partial [Pristionchus mayeri]
ISLSLSTFNSVSTGKYEKHINRYKYDCISYVHKSHVSGVVECIVPFVNGKCQGYRLNEMSIEKEGRIPLRSRAKPVEQISEGGRNGRVWSWCAAFCHLLIRHHLHEFFVVDLTVAIHVDLLDHLVDLVFGELHAHVHHEVAEFLRGDDAVAVFVEHLKSFPDHLRVRLFHHPLHHHAEFRELDLSVAVNVDLVDHFQYFL